MIQRMTVARRARLGENLKTKFSLVMKQIEDGRQTFEIVKASCDLKKDQQKFHRATYLMGLLSYFEGFISDVTHEFLSCFPGHLSDKSFKLEGFAKAGSIAKLIEESAAKSVYETAYKPFPEMMKITIAHFNKEGFIDDQLVGEVNEIKCTRDIYTHSNGKVNETYIRKAGDYARSRLGDELPLTEAYLDEAYTKITRLAQTFYELGPKKYENHNKSKAIEEMWNYTCLAKSIPFDGAWTRSEKEDMVRPAKELRHWSGSEKALYDFFLRIYSTKYPEIDTDILYALYKWPSDTPEGQVMLSWLEGPFYF